MKQKNNKSNDCKDWSDKYLIKTAREYWSCIYVTDCYGVNDLLLLDRYLEELSNRGYTIDEDSRLNIEKE
jgi:hypothetical protein